MSQTLDFLRALDAVGLDDRETVRSASRAIHVRRREQFALHDEVFDTYWSARRAFRGRRGSADPHLGQASGGGPSGAAGAPDATLPIALAGGTATSGTPGMSARLSYSAAEVLRRRQFDRMTAAELAEAERLIDRLALSLDTRPARRHELHAHGTHLAPRQMLRRTLATGGEMLTWVWRRRRSVPRPVVLLIDVSGSMDVHARLMLRLAHALCRATGRAEVFVFGTRLTRVTRQLARRSTDEALARVSAEVADWSGGTRIGAALHEFNRRWAVRVDSSDGIVVVLSDGWDRGDPAQVARETARLSRNSHRLLWLNPLAGTTGYQPLAAGMAAAVRHVDRLLPAGSLADLDDFASLLAASRWGREAHTAAIKFRIHRVGFDELRRERQPLRTSALRSSTA